MADALKLGSLVTDIEGNTTSLLAAEKETKRSTKKINNDLKNTEKVAKEAFTGVEKSAKKANKGFKLAGRGAGQAGIQVQQMVGQIQGGQSAFVALSQQGADLGIVLGAPLVGVVVSLAAVLAGVLWEALGRSAEAAERAKTSASDLNKEYLKLIGSTKELAAITAAEQMLIDAKAANDLSEALKDLIARRDNLEQGRRAGVGLGVGEAGLKRIQETKKEIVEMENQIALLNLTTANAQKELTKLFESQPGFAPEPISTEAPIGGGKTFDQIVMEQIATLELRSRLFNDSDAKIEAEIMRFQLAALQLFEEGSDDFLAAEQALADKRVELHKTADEKIAQQNKQASDKLIAERKSAQLMALSGMAQLGEQLNQVLKTTGKEGTVIGKALFLANKALAVANILVNTQAAAAAASTVASIAGPLGYFTTKAGILASGTASAGLVAGLAVSDVFEHGGIVGGNSFQGDRINVGVNSEEMILTKRQQAKLFNMANGGGGGSGTPNITLINNGTPQNIDSVQVTQNDLTIVKSDAIKTAVQQVNNSLSSGRGSSFKALQAGTKIQRNI